MDSNDRVEKHECGETPKDASTTDAIGKNEIVEIPADNSHIVAPEKEDTHPRVKAVMTAYYPIDADFYENWADLEVEYSWNASGTSFTCNTVRYRVKANNRHRGNIIFGFSSATSWDTREISNDNASQDGSWRNISAGGTVVGNANTASIYFEYIFDMGFSPDPWASVRWTLTFSLAPPTITNPRVVWVPRPKLSGTGVAGATVELYQHNVGTILFATKRVENTNTWEVQLTEPLWMADPFTMTALQTLNGKPSDWAAPVSFAVLFKPVISSVTVSADGRPTVRGTGGLNGATIEIYFYVGAGGVQLTAPVQPNGSWSVSADEPWAPKTYIIHARQFGPVTEMNSDFGDHSIFTVKPPKPVITALPDPVPTNQQLNITGVYSGTGTVTLTMFNLAGFEISGNFSPSTGTTRSFTPTPDWTPGTQQVKVVQTVDGLASDPSDLVTLRVRPPKLAITALPNPVPADQQLTITNVYSDLSVLTMLTEAGAEIRGAFSVTGASRTFRPIADWAPGTQRVKAVQQLFGTESEPSDLCTLRVKPPKPVITNPGVVWIPRPTINGTGVAGALVKVHQHNVPSIDLGEDTVNGNTWAAALTRPLPMADPFTMTASQTVNGIQSDWADLISFAVLFKLVISSITVSPDGRPTVSGTGALEGATVDIRFQGGAATQLTPIVQSGGSWLATASAPWGPNTYTITAKQIGRVTQQSSDWADHKTFTVAVKPSKPAITAPPNPTPADQQLTITGVSSDTVTLTMLTEAGTEISGTFNGTGTTRTFRRAVNWTPGTHRVKVVQTVGGATSDPSDLAILRVQPLTLVIFSPPNPTPANQVLDIAGVYSAAATLTMLTEAGAEISGTFSASGTAYTFTPEANWTPGTHKVKVVQTVGDVPSEPSDLATLRVQPPKPAITALPGPIPADQPLTITGVYSGTVTLTMLTEAGAEISGSFSPTTGTTRTFTPEAGWEPGTQKVKVVQTVGGVTSDPSDLSTLVVKPPKPMITNPGVVWIPQPTISGTGVDGALVKLNEHNVGGVVFGEDTVNENTWAATLTRPLPMADPFTMTASQTLDGTPSDWADPVSFAVLFKLIISEITVSPDGRPTVSGTGAFEGANVDIRFQGGAATQLMAIVQPDGSWLATASAPWASNTYTLTAKQVGRVTQQSSDWADHKTFTVAVKPPKPAISALPDPVPADQQLNITGVYSGTGTVTLKMFSPAGFDISGSFSPSTGTTRTFTPEPDWKAGTQQVKVVQTVDGVASDPSDLATLRVIPPKPAITAMPDPVPANQRLTITNVYSDFSILTVLTEAGDEIPGTSSAIGTTRTFTPTAGWAPGTQKVKVVQTVHSVASEPSDLATLRVIPPKPAIRALPDPVPADQQLIITDVYSSTSTVTLTMFTHAGAEVSGRFSSTGTTRTFTPEANWAAGTHQVKVVQTVGGVESDPSDECTFIVESEEKPEVPQFELPLPGARTSTRPLIRVTGEPRALMTVRHEGAQTLHSDTASTEGVLEFVAATPLPPGPNALEVKQKGDGPESDWSEPHRFTVKEPPQTPVIDAPTPGSLNPRKPTIRGKGETRGQILLRHENDPENLIDSLNGLTSWRWTAQTPWDIGRYTIQARQTDDGDDSSWTESRTFEVIDARYGVGDAGPVLAQPVLSNNESVLLRVQVVSGVTGEAAEGVAVEWRIPGEQAVLATTVTDPDGWARYRYTPGTAGAHTVLADLTNENQGVVITQPFEVTALQDDAWAQTFELYLEGEKVDLAHGDLALLDGRSYELRLEAHSASPLMDASVTLEDLSEAETLGLEFVPPLGTPQALVAGQSVHWSITCDTGKSAYFGLKLTSSILPDWHLPGRVIAQDLSEEVEGHFDTFAQVFGGDPAYPCLGATHTLTVRPNARSLLLGKDVTLELTEEAAALGVTVSPAPDIPQPLGANGVSWSLSCVDSSRNGRFEVRLKVPEWENFSSLELPMSLGHNKVEITERFGPAQTRTPAYDWTYGIRATSTFTGQAAGGVPVTVAISGQLPAQRTTDESGWIYVHYFEGESASLTIRNLYDGSYA